MSPSMVSEPLREPLAPPVPQLSASLPVRAGFAKRGAAISTSPRLGEPAPRAAHIKEERRKGPTGASLAFPNIPPSAHLC